MYLGKSTSEWCKYIYEFDQRLEARLNIQSYDSAIYISDKYPTSVMYLGLEYEAFKSDFNQVL